LKKTTFLDIVFPIEVYTRYHVTSEKDYLTYEESNYVVRETHFSFEDLIFYKYHESILLIQMMDVIYYKRILTSSYANVRSAK